MDELKPLVCENCGGYIDRKTMCCPYCGAQFFYIPVPSNYVSQSEYDSLGGRIEELKRENKEIEMQILAEKFRREYVKRMLSIGRK